MIFKNLCILVRCTNAASALEGLRCIILIDLYMSRVPLKFTATFGIEFIRRHDFAKYFKGYWLVSIRPASFKHFTKDESSAG